MTYLTAASKQAGGVATASCAERARRARRARRRVDLANIFGGRWMGRVCEISVVYWLRVVKNARIESA